MNKKIKTILSRFYTRPLVWDTITTTGWSSIGKGAGFLVPFFIAAWFGITSETDAFFFVYGLILFFSVIFAPVVESAIVPFINEIKISNEDVGKFVGRVLGISGLGLIVVSGLLLLIIKPILQIITKFSPSELDLIYKLFIETSPLVILLIWTSILSGVLNAYKKFVFPALAPAFRATVNIAVIFLFKDRWGVHSIAWGYVLGEAVRLVMLFLEISRLKLFKISLSFNLDKKFYDFFKTSSYLVIGMSALGLNPVVDKIMASWLSKGSVSVLEYAYRLYIIPVTFISSGFMVTLLSHWSSRYYESGINRLKNDVKKALKAVGLISLFITISLIVFYRPIVKIAFGRGAFDLSKLSEVGLVWVCYMVGFVPYMLGRVFMRAHLTLKNTKVLMKYGFIAVILNIVLNYMLMIHFKTAGIALSTSLATLIYFVYMYKAFLKKVKTA